MGGRKGKRESWRVGEREGEREEERKGGIEGRTERVRRGERDASQTSEMGDSRESPSRIKLATYQ